MEFLMRIMIILCIQKGQKDAEMFYAFKWANIGVIVSFIFPKDRLDIVVFLSAMYVFVKGVRDSVSHQSL